MRRHSSLSSSWKSRARRGRPCEPREIRELIRQISLANPRWGAPRIHGELLKLGIDIGETTAAKYIVRPRTPSSQTWKTFLKNHMRDMVSTDFFVVPTATFRLLFVFLMLSHDRRRIVHVGVTAHPTAEGQHNNSSMHFHGIPHLDTYSVTETEVTESHFRKWPKRCRYGKSSRLLAHLGRMLMLRG